MVTCASQTPRASDTGAGVPASIEVPAGTDTQPSAPDTATRQTARRASEVERLKVPPPRLTRESYTHAAMSPLRLLGTRRFGAFFWAQFLGAFNDNLFRNALVV